jgi:hypothetical protein
MPEQISWKEKVDFDSPVRPSYRGRNGFGNCCGLEGFSRGEAIRIMPVNSKGTSASCHIEIPASHIEEAIAMLQVLKRRTP